jgi:hypothetical protein
MLPFAMQSVTEIEDALEALGERALQKAPGDFVSRFRSGIARTLTDIREDNKAHGLTGNEPFFDLVMFDASPVDEALFLVPIFRAESVKIYAGRALPHTVIQFGNEFAMREVDEMEAALGKHPTVDPEPLEIARSLAEFWLSY